MVELKEGRGYSLETGRGEGGAGRRGWRLRREREWKGRE